MKYLPGESAHIFQDFLFLLPEPYNLARQNSFMWVVEYIDSQEEDIITFDLKVDILASFYLYSLSYFQEGPLRLETMKTLLPREKSQVKLRRKDKTITPLHKLAKDVIVKKKTLSYEDISSLDFPKTLEEEVISLKKYSS